MEKMGGAKGKTKFLEKTGIETEKKEEKNNRLLFWNIARLKNKDKNFWKFLKKFKYIGHIDGRNLDGRRILGSMGKNTNKEIYLEV